MKSKHIPVLDSLRAFAALAVCLYHFICTTSGLINTQWILSVFSSGQYGVQTFFVISGFVIPWAMYTAEYRPSNFLSFFFKRITRLEPPYLISLLIAIALLTLRAHIIGPSEQQGLSWERLVLHFGYLVPFSHYLWLNPVYWTLAVEFQYYLLIAILFTPAIKGGFTVRLALYALMIAAGSSANAAFLPHWLPVFLLGIILFLFKAGRIQIQEYVLVTATTFVFLAYMYSPMTLPYVAIPVLALLFFSQTDIKVGAFLGRMSYSVYLIHPLIGASFINVLSHHATTPTAKVLVIIGGVIVTLISAWIMFRLVEKPSKQLSATIHYR